MSVATYLEVGTVIATRSRSDRLGAIALLDTFLTDAEIELRPVDEAQARIALEHVPEKWSHFSDKNMLHFK
jgi:uncharacterized protein with PIN domain